MNGSSVARPVSFTGAAAVPITIPESGIRLILQACVAGEWAKAVGFIRGGKEAWQKAPDDVRGALEAITDGGRATCMRVESTEIRGMQLILHVTTLAGHKALRQTIWRFERHGTGWHLLEVS